MDFIQSSNKQVDKFGPGKHGFSAGNPTGGILATYFTNLWADGVQQEIINAIEDAGLVPDGGTLSQLLSVLNRRGQTAGAARNLRAAQAAAAASLTFTADEVVLKAALGGSLVLLSSLNKTINLATVGAGGMDTGAAPASGWVAVYAIWSRASGASALLGVNATSSIAPEIYGGANMPSGYTHSALIGVVPTNASSQIPAMRQIDREVYYFNSLISTSTNVGFTSLSMAAAVPRNAWRWKGNCAFSAFAATGVVSMAVGPTSAGQGTPGYTNYSGYAVSGGPTPIGGTIPDCPIFTPQTTFYALTASATLTINSYGYTF